MCTASPDMSSEPETNTEQEQLRVVDEDEERRRTQKSGIQALTVSLNSGASNSKSGGSSLKA